MITYKPGTVVFVFGSNLGGFHGAGAALTAKKEKGAVQGIGIGPTGECYAIPTKDEKIRTLPLFIIRGHVDNFIQLTHDYLNVDKTVRFQVTRVGCGLAGYVDGQIAPLFKGAASNCMFPKEWMTFLPDYETWGSFDVR